MLNERSGRCLLLPDLMMELAGEAAESIPPTGLDRRWYTPGVCIAIPQMPEAKSIRPEDVSDAPLL